MMRQALLSGRYGRVLVMVIVLAAGIFVYKTYMTPQGGPNQGGQKVVEVEQVMPTTLRQTARFLGTIRSKHATPFIAKETGILDIRVPAGHTAKQGEIIATIESNEYRRSVELSKSTAKIAKDQYERALALYHKGNASSRTLEDKKAGWMAAEKNLATSQIELDRAQFQAPFDGIVGVYKVREGTQVQVGDPVVLFYDPLRLMVEFEIPDTLMPHIQDGQRVDIAGKPYALTHVQRMLDEDTHMCPAYVDLSCSQCLIGSVVDVDLTVQEKPHVLTVPVEAVFLKSGKSYVYTVQNGKAILTPVETGMTEKDRVEILSGLKSGDIIVAIQPGRLFDGAPVQGRDVKNISSDAESGKQ